MLTVRNGLISCIFEANITAAAAARDMILLSAGRRGCPPTGKSTIIERKGEEKSD